MLKRKACWKNGCLSVIIKQFLGISWELQNIKLQSNITDQYITEKHDVWDIATPKRCRKVESNPKIVTDLMLSASFGGVTTMNGRDDDFCLRIFFLWILDHTFFRGIKLPRPPKGCFGPVEQRDLRFACKCYVWNDIPITDTWSWPFKVAVSELRDLGCMSNWLGKKRGKWWSIHILLLWGYPIFRQIQPKGGSFGYSTLFLSFEEQVGWTYKCCPPGVHVAGLNVVWCRLNLEKKRQTPRTPVSTKNRHESSNMVMKFPT